MKRAKIAGEVQQAIKEVAAAGAPRDARIDIILTKYRLSQNEIALKALCKRRGGGYDYWS